MKILLLAGEESGLIYANRLKELLAGNEIRGYDDYGFKTADLAVMGFMAVISRIGYFLNVKKTMERAIDEFNPDVVCTIDYPGMNLKLAAYAKKKGIRTVHVVCPQEEKRFQVKLYTSPSASNNSFLSFSYKI